MQLFLFIVFSLLFIVPPVSSLASGRLELNSLKTTGAEILDLNLAKGQDVLELYSSMLAGERPSELLPFNIRQNDLCQENETSGCATEVHPVKEQNDYKRAIEDPFYGYRLFFVIDKARGVAASRGRFRQQSPVAQLPQTLYVFARREDNSIEFVKSYAVSTGVEVPNITVIRRENKEYHHKSNRDTREGFHRVQSAQRHYTSGTFEEEMPHSLWFENEYGTAIHETTDQKCQRSIGLRASMGCTRLCAGDAAEVFRMVVDLDAKFSDEYKQAEISRRRLPMIGATPIVLLEKTKGVTYFSGTKTPSWQDQQSSLLHHLPKVIRGHAVFVRILNSDFDAGKKEIQGLLGEPNSPTHGVKRYFKRISPPRTTGGGLL